MVGQVWERVSGGAAQWAGWGRCSCCGEQGPRWELLHGAQGKLQKGAVGAWHTCFPGQQRGQQCGQPVGSSGCKSVGSNGSTCKGWPAAKLTSEPAPCKGCRLRLQCLIVSDQRFAAVATLAAAARPAAGCAGGSGFASRASLRQQAYQHDLSTHLGGRRQRAQPLDDLRES